MKRLLILLLAALLPLFSATPASAWGPTAHENIGQTVIDWVMVDRPAFQAGVVMTDVALARAPSDRLPTSHWMFHQPAYVSALRTLATTSELKSFAQGWQAHVVSDDVQNAYGDVDEAVDAILGIGAVRSITLTSGEADLMISAWTATYPSYPWQPTRDWILEVQTVFNVYLSRPDLFHTPAQREAALIAWPGYRTYLTLSAKNSLDAIVKRGDANRDGLMNMGDVVYIERVILNMSARNAEADANGNWTVDMGDVIWVERKMLGY